MDYLKINSSKIKISLTRSECRQYGISEVGGDFDQRLVREVISDILEDAGAGSFCRSREKLLVQLYPTADGGAEIFVTKLSRVGERVERAISRADNLETMRRDDAHFVFDNPRDLYRALLLLPKKKRESDLYRRADGKYILKTEEESFGILSDCDILSEFGVRVPKGAPPPSEEWDRVIFRNDAIERIIALGKRQ